eukprot:3645357-Rhodomonas_salina.1
MQHTLQGAPPKSKPTNTIETENDGKRTRRKVDSKTKQGSLTLFDLGLNWSRTAWILLTPRLNCLDSG